MLLIGIRSGPRLTPKYLNAKKQSSHELITCYQHITKIKRLRAQHPELPDIALRIFEWGHVAEKLGQNPPTVVTRKRKRSMQLMGL